ncbi:MAG: SIS domain-containing protein [Erysipelotrichaceae bacterium]|nr:SIS domain-containing protein [Erysipelotrichaceae bacterium]MDY5251596.1 SIS domain-containing protein [Erysipelotrichaceae bacterium]
MINTIIKEIESRKKSFTAKEMEVFEILKNDTYAFRSSTATEIAAKYKISQSAISRFCQKLGYSGFSDFRLSLFFNSPFTNDVKIYNNTYYINILNSICNSLDSTISTELLSEISHIILNARSCYTSGYGASDIAAKMLAFQCMVQSVNVFHLPSTTEVETLHIINNKDVVILFSALNSSHRDFFSMIEELPEQRRPYIILIANTPRHPFSKKVDKMILLPNTQDIDQTILFTPSITQILFTFLLVAQVSLAKINDNI